jgi:hypothetical protein
MKKFVVALIGLGILLWLCSVSLDKIWKEEEKKADKALKETIELIKRGGKK